MPKLRRQSRKKFGCRCLSCQEKSGEVYIDPLGYMHCIKCGSMNIRPWLGEVDRKSTRLNSSHSSQSRMPSSA